MKFPSKAKIQRFTKIYPSENNPLYGTLYDHKLVSMRLYIHTENMRVYAYTPVRSNSVCIPYSENVWLWEILVNRPYFAKLEPAKF